VCYTHPTPAYPVATSSSSKILNANQNPRKPPVKLGELERLVLLYASTVARRFTISDIVVAYNLKQFYNGTANRRVYDSVQRLIRRGYIRKIDRGIYELSVDISPDLLKDSLGVEVKENLGGAPAFLLNRESKPFSSRRNNVLRIHFRGVSGYLELYRKLLVVRCYMDIAVRRLEDYLIKLGVSKCQIKKLRRYKYSCYDFGVVIGAHGGYKCRSKPLVPASGGFFYELGIDIYVAGGLDKMFAKVYTDVLPSPFSP